MYDVKFSRRLELIQFSRAVCHVTMLKIGDSEALAMGIRMVPKMSVIFDHLKRLISREN